MDPLNASQLSELLKVAQTINSPAALLILVTILGLWTVSILIKVGVIPNKQDKLLGRIAQDSHDTLELMKKQVDYRESIITLRDLAWGRMMNFRDLVMSELMNLYVNRDVHSGDPEGLKKAVKQAFISGINYVETILTKVPASDDPGTSRMNKLKAVDTYLDSILKVFNNAELTERDVVKRLKSLVDTLSRNEL